MLRRPAALDCFECPHGIQLTWSSIWYLVIKLKYESQRRAGLGEMGLPCFLPSACSAEPRQLASICHLSFLCFYAWKIAHIENVHRSVDLLAIAGDSVCEDVLTSVGDAALA